MKACMNPVYRLVSSTASNHPSSFIVSKDFLVLFTSTELSED